ncbi:MAG: hypothetical protein WCC60_05100 [Ilumatobacteraceae bacterium]
MSDTTLDFGPPLPNELTRLTVVWVRGGETSPTPTARAGADAALVTRITKAGTSNEQRVTLEEADQLLDEVTRLQGRRTRPSAPSTPTRVPRTGPSPRTTPARPSGPPAPAARSRSWCGPCNASREPVGPRHVLSVDDLDGFYRGGLAAARVSVTTVYEYECATCHSLETFTTAR